MTTDAPSDVVTVPPFAPMLAETGTTGLLEELLHAPPEKPTSDMTASDTDVTSERRKIRSICVPSEGRISHDGRGRRSGSIGGTSYARRIGAPRWASGVPWTMPLPASCDDVKLRVMTRPGRGPSQNRDRPERRDETLILSGIAAIRVVLSTLRHATDADYRIVVVEDCCSDGDPDLQEVPVHFLDVWGHLNLLDEGSGLRSFDETEQRNHLPAIDAFARMHLRQGPRL
jgi:hypothetical protein